MGVESKPVNFVFKDQKWDLYEQFRPLYSKAVFDHVYGYHQKHGGQFKEALDMGAGNGVITRDFLGKFEHVTFSDVGEDYVKQAQERFAALGPDKISFLRAGFMDLEPQQLPVGGLDLAGAATCLHFLGKDKHDFIPRMAKLIKPGGTFAGIGYCGMVHFPENEPGHQEANAVFDGLMNYFFSNFMSDSKDSPGALMNAKLDYLEFDPEVWTNVRRTHALYEKPGASDRTMRADSKVKKDVETVESFDANIVSKDANYEWIHGYYVHLYPAMNPEVICKDELAALKKAMGDRTVRLQWPFDMVLATRK